MARSMLWLVFAVHGVLGAFEGVQSGYLTDSTAVVWTKVSAPGTVRLHLSQTIDFATFTSLGESSITAAQGLTLARTISSLKSSTKYFYRFQALPGLGFSDVGTFTTFPSPIERSTGLKFAISGDSDYLHGDPTVGQRYAGLTGFPQFAAFDNNQFKVLSAVSTEIKLPSASSLDFFLFLGDTIYSDSILRRLVPEQYPSAEAQSLAEYREVYQKSRQSKPALQQLMKRVPIFASWDDHEVQNDYTGETVSRPRFNAARQAFLESFPFPPESPSAAPLDPTCAGKPMYRTWSYGSDVDFFSLDTRSCRSASAVSSCLVNGAEDVVAGLPAAHRAFLKQAAESAGLSSSFILPDTSPQCLAVMNSPSRTMLGPTQFNQLKEDLRRSTATFKIILTSVPIQNLPLSGSDKWIGYGFERRKLLEFIRDRVSGQVVFFSTDTHASYIAPVLLDFPSFPGTPTTPVSIPPASIIAYEVVTGPISTFTFGQEVSIFFQSAQAPSFVSLIMSWAGVGCRNLFSDSYMTVETQFDATLNAMSLIIKGKDDSGIPLVSDPTLWAPTGNAAGPTCSLSLTKSLPRCRSISANTPTSWCIDNCNHVPANCPSNLCTCSATAPNLGTFVSRLSTLSDSFCQQACTHVPPALFCDGSVCAAAQLPCTEAAVSPLDSACALVAQSAFACQQGVTPDCCAAANLIATTNCGCAAANIFGVSTAQLNGILAGCGSSRTVSCGRVPNTFERRVQAFIAVNQVPIDPSPANLATAQALLTETARFEYSVTGVYSGFQDFLEYLLFGSPAFNGGILSTLGGQLVNIQVTTPNSWVVVAAGSFQLTGSPPQSSISTSKVTFEACSPRISEIIFDDPTVTSIVRQTTTSQDVTAHCQRVQASCVGANVQFASVAECVTFVQSLPLITPTCEANGRLLQGRSRGCKYLHGVIAAHDPDMHCAHTGFFGGPDPHGRFKCQDSHCSA
eukprot:c39054_g1_i1.p1 GENE.c39054_g1_i1~~c39054_g1_i1.p1  ORF type:complete len:963 (+),score=127.38 c39054_g1_i1:28-2916(+)